MPDELGQWRFKTSSKPARVGLDGQRGQFQCEAASGKTRFERHGAISVSANGHHFQHADGTPFLWLVDTAWNGALKSSREDWNRYLDNRATKGFTGVQFVVTQWRTAYTNAEGQVAYTGYERIKIHPEFFRRIDERVEAVNAKGLLAVGVLLWTLGQRQHNPGQLPESEAIRLARYMVARYGANHVAWFLPGDGNYFDERAERWKRIGRAVFDTADHAPVFIHPQGMQWPYGAFLGERWLSALGYQSGHGDDGRTLAWLHSGPPAQKGNRKPIRPVINLEPPYEDHIAYQSRKRHTDYTVRRTLYWSMLNAPTAGTSYGAHGVWSWESQPKEPQEHGGTGVAKPWFEATDLPGSSQLKHLGDLFHSLRWWELRPDHDFAKRVGKTPPQPARGGAAGLHVAAARSPQGEAIVYLPVGGAVAVKTERLRRGWKAAWFDPRTGRWCPARTEVDAVFDAPDENDWVLVFQPVQKRVTLTRDAVDESAGNVPCLKIDTPTATYYLEKVGAGLSSLIDKGGQDWIGFHSRAGSRASGEYRGFPNAVHRQDGSFFHPKNNGTDPSDVKVVHESAERITILATSGTKTWQGRWDFFPTHCTFTMTRMPPDRRYWILYEGTPGGEYDDSDWWMTSAIKGNQPLTTTHEGDIPAPEWIVFGDRELDRVLFLLHHEDDDKIDRYHQMDKSMTVFGFGRKGLTKYLDTVPRSFSIGFLETTDHARVSAAIDDIQQTTDRTADSPQE
jgi:hypothetical protein